MSDKEENKAQASCCDDCATQDDLCKEAVVEDRRLKHWIIKWSVQYVSIVVAIVVCAITYGYVFQNKEFEGEVTSGIIDNFFTVIKFMFN